MFKYIQLVVTMALMVYAVMMIPDAIDKQYENNDTLKTEYKYSNK